MGDINKKLKETKKELCKSLKERKLLQKAIWDMLNYANMYVVLLGEDLTIKLINWSLATKLGFKDEREPLGECWLEFIKPEEHLRIKAIHSDVTKNKDSKFVEHENDIVTKDNIIISVKWFNIHINTDYNMTFSFGIPKTIPAEITEESIRNYYRDIIEKDKTMIKSLKETVLSEGYISDSVCVPGEK
jgi:hypothetical protein